MKRHTPKATFKFIPAAKLLKFIQRRNKSHHHNNLQFQIDADACNIHLETLGKARKFTVGSFTGYEWIVPVEDNKKVRMVEFGQQLYLETGYDYETTSMFKLMQKAEYAPEPKQAETVSS